MTARARWMAAASVVGIVILIAVAALLWQDAEPTAPDPTNTALVAHGKAIYSQYCASCHGAYLEGQPNWKERQPNGRLPAPPHDPSGHTWHHADKDLFEMVKHGMPQVIPGYQTDMPKYEGVLKDTDIYAVLSYIESTWPPDIRARQQSLSKKHK